MVFTTARHDLKELVRLTEQIAMFDATAAARRDVEPEPSALAHRHEWERKQVDLLRRYDLLDIAP